MSSSPGYALLGGADAGASVGASPSRAPRASGGASDVGGIGFRALSKVGSVRSPDELAQVRPAPDVLPAGQLYHAAGASADGWTVTAVHESQQSWEAFRDEVLLPKLRAGIPGGFEGPPVERTFEVANLVTQKGKQIILT